jgi:hypothetical protein
LAKKSSVASCDIQIKVRLTREEYLYFEQMSGIGQGEPDRPCANLFSKLIPLSTWDRWREAHPSILCPGHFIAVENVFKRTDLLGSASVPKKRDGHGWYCQQEGDQDGCEKGHGAVVPLDSTIYEPRIPTGAFASDCLLLALET